jgi:hypothetical protein
MIRHNSGPLDQVKDFGFKAINVQLLAGGSWGIQLDEFTTWGTVNDQGTGTLDQPWVIGLTPGAIEWSIV